MDLQHTTQTWMLPSKDLLLVTAPFTYTFGPSMAPALLKACAEQAGFSAVAWDLSAEFNLKFENTAQYKDIILWMQHPEILPPIVAFNWYQTIVEEYALRAIKYHTTSIAVSLLTQSSQRFAEDLCYYIRLHAPDIKIMLGGNSVNILQFQYQKTWGQLMYDSKMCDCVIVGEGEHLLAKALQENLEGVIFADQLSNQELDAVPVPNYDDYDMTLYAPTENTFWASTDNIKDVDTGPIFLVTGSKGCIKNCTFCDVANIWSKFRFRSGASVANEIATLHEKYNARFFSFTDSLMNGGLRPFYEMNVALLERIPGAIKYEGQMICRGREDMPEKYFKIMAEAGCFNVNIGIESGSESVRKHMGKGSTNADVAYSTEMFTKYGINQSWNIIAGYPTETEEDWQDTMQLIKTWVPQTNGLLKIYPIDTFLILPDTPIARSELYSLLDLNQENINGYSDFVWTSGANPSNTYDVRARRFIELCELVLDYTSDSVNRERLTTKIEMTNKKLEWYHANKKQKIFSIAQS